MIYSLGRLFPSIQFSQRAVLFFVVLTFQIFQSFQVRAQCDPNNPYDRIISGYHASIALKTNGVFSVWGAGMGTNGSTDRLSPVDVNYTNFGVSSADFGTPLRAALGGSTSGSAVDQAILLTSKGLWAWGVEGVVLGNTLTSSAAFARIATPSGGDALTGLPTGVNPSDVSTIFATYQTLVLVTKIVSGVGGDVWILTQTSLAVEGNGGSVGTAGTSAWKRVKKSATANDYLTNVTMARGQATSASENAFVAQTSSGQLFTWGNTTFLGNASSAAALNYATLMTLPQESGANISIKMFGVSGGGTTGINANTYYVLSTTGNLYSMGDNAQRQLGDFTTTDQKSWVQVKKSATAGDYLTNVKFISVQEHNSSHPTALAVTTVGDLYGWGYNSKLMLGRPTDNTAYDPGFPGGFVSGTNKALFVEAGGHTSLYLKEGSDQFCYVGHRIQGSMGDGTSTDATEATFNCTTTPTMAICGSVPVAADPTKSTISASLSSIFANGTSTSILTVQLKDATGTNLTTTGGTVIVTNTDGTLGTVSDNNDGTYTVTLTSSTSVNTSIIGFSINSVTASGTGSSTNVAFITSSGSPTISSGGSLSTFTACGGTVSAEQSFTVSATDLTADLLVTAPTGFEISLTSGGTFSASVTLTPISGTVASTTIYIRLKSDASSAGSLDVTLSSTGATTGAVTTGSSTVSSISITGTTSVSRLSLSQLTGTGTPAILNAWISSDTTVATISSTGLVRPKIDGTTYITYTQSNGCSKTILFTVLTSDTDGDGVPDDKEIADGTDPNDGCSFKLASRVLTPSLAWNDGDCDGDGISNFIESNNRANNGDMDWDGVPNFLDLDSDGDGIPDQTEKDIDTDKDTRPNFLDEDSDNDGIPDKTEGQTDFDKDGIPNYLDLDSDGDTILDVWESVEVYRIHNDWDLNGTTSLQNLVFPDWNENGLADYLEGGKMGGKPAEVPDTDRDGKPDYLDLDSDNDNIPDVIDNTQDTDKDRRTNFRDSDSDGDGVGDIVEGQNDADKDGIPNYLDLDSDGDGILDSLEGVNRCPTCSEGVDNNVDGWEDSSQFPASGNWVIDTDKDNTPDYLDVDSDNDGIPDAVEAGKNPAMPVDTDKDGMPDYQDLDSDNDGIPDAVEAGKNPAMPVDTDKDGMPDYQDLDSDNDGISDAIEAGKDPSVPVDIDKDGAPDYQDLDSDNDGISDKIEAGADPKNPLDTDKDGIYDFRELDSDNDGIADKLEAGTNPNNPVDTDGDGLPDYRDLDSDGDSIPDKLEAGSNPASPLDTDGDGTFDFRDLDSDGDGFLDRTEAGANPNAPVDTDGDGKPDFQDIDSDNDGILDRLEDDVSFGALPDCDRDGIPNRIDKDVCETYLTQGFSPNGDGVNDTFVIPGLAGMGNNKLTVFNRWGNIVFEANNYKNDWGGKTANSFDPLASDGLLPDGVYYYVIDFNGSRPTISNYLFINRLAK